MELLIASLLFFFIFLFIDNHVFHFQFSKNIFFQDKIFTYIPNRFSICADQHPMEQKATHMKLTTLDLEIKNRHCTMKNKISFK